MVCISGADLCSWQRYEALYVWKRLVSSFYVRLAGRAKKGTEQGAREGGGLRLHHMQN